ncbi:MAG: hypothetical protein WCS88_02145 [Patescibacteria group bacterium]|jgi:anti-sigma regulatory factor (Ser/Thr protein kinase)
MNNENNFSQNIEQPEQWPKKISVQFDQNHFDGQEIDKKAVDYQKDSGNSWLPGSLNNWWKKICLENEPEVSAEELGEIIYYLIEVARNAIEKVGSGEIEVIFDKNKITFVVTDQGVGFENPLQQIKPKHGLYEVRGYADEFTIETNGKKYTKIPNSLNLDQSEETDVIQGSRITFTKNYDEKK